MLHKKYKAGLVRGGWSCTCFIITFLSILKHNFSVSSANPKLSCPFFPVPPEAIGYSEFGRLDIFTHCGLYHMKKMSFFYQIQESHGHHALATVSESAGNPDRNGLKRLI